MTEQNLSNHTRMVPMFHYVTFLLIVAILGGSIVNLVHANPQNHYSAALLVLIALVLFPLFWYCRSFPLKAQDRAIRAEENLRHFILTGKPLDKKLGMGQIIALRFASDEEFPDLAIRALAQNLNAKDIKAAIQNWKPDYNRL